MQIVKSFEKHHDCNAFKLHVYKVLKLCKLFNHLRNIM